MLRCSFASPHWLPTFFFLLTLSPLNAPAKRQVIHSGHYTRSVRNCVHISAEKRESKDQKSIIKRVHNGRSRCQNGAVTNCANTAVLRNEMAWIFAVPVRMLHIMIHRISRLISSGICRVMMCINKFDCASRPPPPV